MGIARGPPGFAGEGGSKRRGGPPGSDGSDSSRASLAGIELNLRKWPGENDEKKKKKEKQKKKKKKKLRRRRRIGSLV